MRRLQSRADSFMEAAINTVIGFGVSMLAWIPAGPAAGIHVTLRQNLEITAVFTAVSICRQYILRRIFNGRTPWETLRCIWEERKNA